ncbi:Glutamate receptor 3.4 [Vitis vinifera]|uniref:Glutamate receptor n=1 Tax=Vitis vinifera TaxID=29760 RepID=A0A438JHT8_VITVI|nr:Glutamate receptor 3.4 [Vitis vinifera]
MRHVVALPLALWVCVIFHGSVLCQRPAVVNIGAVFTFDSVIGRPAKVAMKVAVSDVNSDPRILNGTELNLIMGDAKCSVFMGCIAEENPRNHANLVLRGLITTFFSVVLERQVLAIIGPQSSSIAHMISQIANSLQVPQISYAATDPTLSTLQFPFFLRTTHSDSYQMAAMADLIDYYGWKEVIVIFVDDDYGRNGMAALDDELEKRGSKISYKLPLPTEFNVRDFTEMLNKSKLIGPRVYVVHVNPDPSFRIFSIAQKLQMMTRGYVWLATDWLCATLDSFSPMNQTSLRFLQGGSWTSSTYSTIQEEGCFCVPVEKNAEKRINFTGLTGQIQFDPERNVINGSYDVINIVHTEIRGVGYWSNYSGLSVLPPEDLKGEQNRNSLLDQKLRIVTWPGGITEKPRGWEIAANERPLRLGIPKRTSFVDFVTELNNSHKVQGYCIDVFNAALKLVPYNVPHTFIPFGDGRSNPHYDELVQKVADDVFDGVVGDVAIVTNRTRIVDFTQPYAATGLVIVAPVHNTKLSAWVFLKPFTVEMWCVTAAAFVMIAVVIWILEHRVNDDFRGPPKRQLITMFLRRYQKHIRTDSDGGMAFLIDGIDSLIASDLPIGYQVGSFAFSYLRDSLYVHQSRLVSLGSPEAYEMALRKGPKGGGVAAIVDELPYVELFLEKQKDFGVFGQTFTKSGWGFAFQKDSPLAADLSTAILRLSETGTLQKIHENWFCKMGCPGWRRRKSEPNQLHMISFWGLYLLCGSITLIALLVFLLRTIRQFARYKRKKPIQIGDSPSVSSNTRCSQVIYNFFDFIDEKEEAIKKMFKQQENPQPQLGLIRNLWVLHGVPPH